MTSFIYSFPHSQLECERGERLKLEHAVKTGSLPDDAKMGVTSLGAEMAAAKLNFSAGACDVLLCGNS